MTGNPSSEDVRAALERALASPGFARNERLSRFLRFVVERQVEGRESELKESVVGVEVFGRKPGFDPKLDSTVRSEAARLRARLLEYYGSTDGQSERLRITLPKGGYVPHYEWSAESAGPAAPPASPVRTQRSAIWFAAGLAVVAIAALSWYLLAPRGPITIAVLPFQNVSGNSADDYFADGLTDEVIRDLSLIDGIAPRSWTSSFAMKGSTRPVREIGRELQAEYLLEGTVLRNGAQLRVDVQLVRIGNDRPVWSGRFDRQVTDVVAIQDDISRGVVNNLRLSLGAGRRRYETSFEAYDLYLRARSMELQRGLPGLSDSVDAFQAVIEKDSAFAPAYAGLALAHAARSGQFRFDLPAEAVRMRAAATRAVELDPLLTEAHDALGIALARDSNWRESERSFRRAIELNPGNADAHRHFAIYMLLAVGRIDEALEQFGLAERRDPLSAELHFQAAYALLSAGRFDDASRRCEKLPADFWGKPECTSRVLLGKGRVDEAIGVLEARYREGVPEGSEVRGYLGYAYARAGRRADLDALSSNLSGMNPFNMALISAGLGDKDRCLEALERATIAGPGRLGWALGFPEYAVLRGDPRVATLRARVGLPAQSP